MFAKRNSITLAAIWLILLLVGIFLYVKDTRRLVEAMHQKVTLSTKLESSQHEIARLKGIEDEHSKLSQLWLSMPKKIVSADEPSFSLSYFNWIMTRYRLVVDFDFELNQIKQLDSYTKYVYTLNGESAYGEILRLIWHITHEPILYRINSIRLNSTGDPQLLSFSIELEGYAMNDELEIAEFSELSPASYASLPVQHDIFAPIIKPKPKRVVAEAPKLPPKLPGQIDVELASLQAVTSNSIFIADPGNGVKELKVGDAVYLGRLVRIDTQRNEAEFRITKFGKTQRITLGINYRK